MDHSSKMQSTRETRKFLPFRFLLFLFLAGIDYLPSKTYNNSCSPELSSRSSLSIGVYADVVLMSTFVEVTETVPPPPATTATATALASQDTDAETVTAVATATATAPATDTAVATSVTALRGDDSQSTASGGGQAMVQVPVTAVATSKATTATFDTGMIGALPSADPGEVQVSGLAGVKTDIVTISAAPSGITTSSIRGKASQIATSTPIPTSTSKSAPSTQKFPTYAAGLASGTAIIAAAGAFTAIYLVRRRNRRHGQRRKPSPVNEIGQVNKRPISIRKLSEVMGMTNLNLSRPWGGDGDKLTSMKPPPDIDLETSWPRGHVPPDAEELRDRMDDEKRRSSGGGRERFESAVDLGIGYVSSASATPGDTRDGYFDGYTHENTRPLSGISMPDNMKPFMTPLQPHHTHNSVLEPVNRLDTVSPSVYSRRDSIVTSFGEIHAKIDGNNSFNLQREEYRVRKEQARQQFAGYDFVEEEPPDEWIEHDKSLEERAERKTLKAQEYSSPDTPQGPIASPVNDYFSTRRSSITSDRNEQHSDYFAANRSSTNADNRESQYEDIDLSQNDPYVETANNNKRSSGGYFGRLFGRS